MSRMEPPEIPPDQAPAGDWSDPAKVAEAIMVRWEDAVVEFEAAGFFGDLVTPIVGFALDRHGLPGVEEDLLPLADAIMEEADKRDGPMVRDLLVSLMREYVNHEPSLDRYRQERYPSEDDDEDDDE